ncbi:MAG: DUF3570 domain-containing protein [Gammaproteobacteria bacterium]|nr:DUF3570 domain-containing protein [Gammaproteobacteria bacterium]
MQLSTFNRRIRIQHKKSNKTKSTAKIATALATASCSLLGAHSGVYAAEVSADMPTKVANENAWEFDSTVLFYSETDRVSAIEPVISARKEYGEDQFLNLKLVFDSLTGSSPNGATAAAHPQTITTSSGTKDFVTNANETPLDPTFLDTRVAVSASWEQPLTRLTKISFGGNFSNEFDYQSVSANTTISHDFNQRNSTLNYGISFASDTISPVGDVPIPLTVLTTPSEPKSDRGEDSDTRTTVDFLVGVSQVISRRTIMQFNYSLGDSSGYHTDPYKILSVIDDTPGATFGDTVTYRHEGRPEDRRKQSFYWQTKHHFDENIADISYRYYWDDWGIKSHTLDFRYRWKFVESNSYLEPHFRFYSQNAADFYAHSLVNSAPIPEFASADYRLGEFDATTIGIKYGKILSGGHEFSIRAEVISQDGDSSPSDAIGSQQSQDLFPSVEAVLIQASYSFNF